MIFLYTLVFQLGVMTYSDMTAQSPETQAAVEHEVRVLLKVGSLTHSLTQPASLAAFPDSLCSSL